MTVTVDSFRQSFMAFGDEQQFPPSEIQYWITLAYKLHNSERWGDLLDHGVSMYVAHNVTIELGGRSAAAAGGSPGALQGPVTSGSADGVSYSRDLSGVLDADAGHWNLTHYGLRWRGLVKMVGAGPLQIGVPSPADGATGAWPGPFPSPW
jgi:hypothetical protein